MIYEVLYTEAEALANFESAKKAYTNALSSKSYSLGERSKTNQDLSALKKEMNYWARIVKQIQAPQEFQTFHAIKVL